MEIRKRIEELSKLPDYIIHSMGVLSFDRILEMDPENSHNIEFGPVQEIRVEHISSILDHVKN